MKRVHEIVDYGYTNGAYVILNIHHETWNYAFSENLEKAETILVAIWNQIAAEFADYDDHLIFEGMNEPRKVGSDVEWTGGDQEGWDFVNEMNALFVKTIRATGGKNASRQLMVPTYAASAVDNAINGFKLPQGDDNVIVSIHAYTPYNFALNPGDGAVTTFSDTGDLDYLFNLINTKFISQNVGVIIGEMGAMSRDNDAERAKWAEAYTSKASALGVPCVVWDNGLFEGEGELFGLIDRETFEIRAPEVVKAFMKGIGSTGPVPQVKKEGSSKAPEVEVEEKPEVPEVPEVEEDVETVTQSVEIPEEPEIVEFVPDNEPEVPEFIPEVPEVPEFEPEVPEVPEFEPEVPEVPEFEPEVETEVPEPPVTPEIPEPPVLPEIPEPPVTPEIPEPPVLPEIPEPPVTPEIPEPPVTPEIPEPPVTPEIPEPPVTPEIPEPPVTPETPKTELSGDYYSCGDDWDCKKEKATACYKEADACWITITDGDYSKCAEIIEGCNKIWYS